MLELEAEDSPTDPVTASSAKASGRRAPHLHSSTRLGTRRPHDGHVHERFGEAA
jgi:hypothetical protein